MGTWGKSRFSQTQKIGNIAIIAIIVNFVFQYIFLFRPLFALYDVGKCEIRCHWVQEDYILMMQTSVIEFSSNGVAKTKLAILAFLYCGRFVKNFNVIWVVF